MPDCDSLLLSYFYRNTSVASVFPPIIYSRWEVRNSVGNLLATLEDTGKIDFYYAFPFLDTFIIKLTVRDSGLNEDSVTKTYVVDECPVCVQGGGGGPSGPAMAERYKDSPGKITLIRVSSEDYEKCEMEIKTVNISSEELDDPYFPIKQNL
jgi:hypothetical protein